MIDVKRKQQILKRLSNTLIKEPLVVVSSKDPPPPSPFEYIEIGGICILLLVGQVRLY